ncbi:MAG: hypothetical protein WA063_02220 [Minisyncoccia bacterium]
MDKDNEIKDDIANEQGKNLESIKILPESSKIKKNKSSLNSVSKKILIVIILAIVWIGIVQYISADKYEAVVRVVEQGGDVGVNPMTDRLDYGDLPKGNSASRFISIENNGTMAIYVKIVKNGNIGELIKISKNDFELKPGEKEKLELSLSLPISADREEYKGGVTVFKIPRLF